MPLERPIPRINVLNYRALGQKMIKWATDRESRPETLPEFVREVDGIIELPLPAWIKGLQFVQSNNETLLIRLPPKEVVEDSLERIAAGTGRYPFPNFYEQFILEEGEHDQQAIFEFRVGDYTIAHCT
jgi:hypothetical protein